MYSLFWKQNICLKKTSNAEKKRDIDVYLLKIPLVKFVTYIHTHARENAERRFYLNSVFTAFYYRPGTMMQHLSINRLESGGLITNYQCSSRCGHCLYRCGPRWPADYIEDTTARSNMETMLELGCSSIHIGGGESLLKPDRLCNVLDIAADTGMKVEYVETNSSWVKSSDIACGILEKMMKSGLSTLLISISPFHNEYIPFTKVKTLMAACRKTGMAVFPWIPEFINEIECFDDKKTHERVEYEERFGEDYWDDLPNRYWISMGGRALETFGKAGARSTVHMLMSRSRSGCRELGQTDHFHIDLYGNFIPGLCTGLSIACGDLGRELLPEEYPVVTTLYNEGIGGLLHLAMEQYGFEAAKPSYRVKCELCHEIRKYLVLECKLDTKELQPGGHYRNG